MSETAFIIRVRKNKMQSFLLADAKSETIEKKGVNGLTFVAFDENSKPTGLAIVKELDDCEDLHVGAEVEIKLLKQGTEDRLPVYAITRVIE